MVVIVIALFLIAATLAFEFMRDGLEEAVTEDMQIILEKLFGELTILGFLAIVTFVLTQTGILQKLSIEVFGEEEELLEYFEAVHFSIFFIMVFFVFQVLILIKEASETEKQWDEMDLLIKAGKSRSRKSMAARQSTREAFMDEKKERLLAYCFPQLRNKKKEQRRMHFIFKALREEFLLERSLEPSFAPAPHDRRVEDDFDFGRYLALAQARTLTRIVEVEERTWMLFGIGIIVFFAICLLANRDVELISWIWVGLGWLVLIGNIRFEKHLVNVRNKFIPKNLLYSANELSSNLSITLDDGKSEGATESTNLMDAYDGPDTQNLPSWCDVDIHEYRKRRNIILKWFVGGKPNRQQAMFLMDSFGPSLYFILLQANLVYVGVYAGLLLLSFGPFIYHIYPWPLSTLYTILALAPVVGISYNKKRVVSALSQVSSVGAYRKPQIVNDVLLETKTARVVRTFLIIHKMWHTAKFNLVGPTKVSKAQMKDDAFTELERSEVSKSFDAIDADRSGAISHEEFRDLLTRLGADLTDEAFTRMVNTLDADGDGEVTKEEFLTWYFAHSAADEMSLEERAKDLFEMFDDDKSGELSIGELKSKIDALDMGFTVDEIGAIVNELDKDRSGTVSDEEFHALLKKYYPKELNFKEDYDEEE